MKNRNGENLPFDQVTLEVARIIFSDDNLTDLNVRLTRIALERYNVPEVISPGADANGRVNGFQDEHGDPFDQIVPEVARIIFGDDNLTDLNVRLARIALERYNVPEIISSQVDESTRGNGSSHSAPASVASQA